MESELFLLVLTGAISLSLFRAAFVAALSTLNNLER